MLRTVSWVAAAALTVLLARSIAYAVAPSPAARLLEHRAGGPALPVLTLVALALGASFAIAVCWLASVAVRERALLERRSLVMPMESFRIGRALIGALVLAAFTSFAGGLIEAYLHWRAGLGWHGLQCVFGPLHRDLIPIETGLSFVAAAIIAAADHVAAWMRRTFALFRELPPASLLEPAAAGGLLDLLHELWSGRAGNPRAPPAFS
ncbi:MAG: hypothetical protein QOF27_2394 [Gaiellaceae bacterium]|jgi:hypothetical protein|nr:hypothetical protein [Gaiellaceae bacterium]